MQTTTTHPIFTKYARHPVPGAVESEVHWIMPGKPLYLAPGVVMGIEYDDENNATFKFWHDGKRIKSLRTNSRRQLDLRTSLGMIITQISDKHDTLTGYVEKTLIEIAPVPLHLIGADLGGQQ